MQAHTSNVAYQPIGYLRGKGPRKVVLPLLPPSAHEVILLDCFEELRYVRGIVLEISVHSDYDISAREIETCRKGRSLPEVSPQAQYYDIFVLGLDLFEQPESAIGAAVVYIDDLIVADVFHGRTQPLVKYLNIFFFVI